jgi:hypothetical protein
VEDEETTRIHAAGALHDPVEEVLEKLEVIGRFVIAGGGYPRIIGSPDFSWIASSSQHSTVVSVSTTSCVHIVVEFYFC